MQPTHENNPLAALVASHTSEARRGGRGVLLATLTIAGIALYVILDVIVQALPPHYSPISQAESDLAVGPYGYLMAINFAIRGLLSLALLGALVSLVAKKSLSQVGLALLGIWGVGALILAVSPTDLAGAHPTLHGIIHLLVATLAFACGAVGALLLSLSFARDTRLQSLRTPAMVIATLAIIALFPVLFGTSVNALQHNFGLFERIFIGLVLLWMLIVAFHLRALRMATI